MLKKVRLFILGMEADLDKEPEILFNYAIDDLTNPTVVKNSFSKSLTLLGTPANNRIFGQFWDNEKEIGITPFNPTKKAEFQLFINGDIYEQGYVKLDSVTDTNGIYKYSITLYGGLGDFFYNLAHTDGGDGKKKMSDLHYMDDTVSVNEFDFKINKETIAEAWQALDDSGETKWKYINFMPSYDGIPEDFDADKVLINTLGTELVTGYTESDSAYTTFDGYALGTMANEHTADEMREYRSYLLRPCLNVRKAIEAICKPENNGGYTVELDSDFFKDENQYWNKTWMTLPLLTSFENLPGEAVTGSSLTMGNVMGKGGDTARTGFHEYRYLVPTNFETGKAYSIEASFTLGIRNIIKAGAGRSVPNYVDLNWFYDAENQYASCIIIQMVAYNSLGTAIAGSDAICLTSEKNPGYYPTIDLWGYKLPYGTKYTTSIGRFKRISDDGRGTNYVEWNQPLSMTINGVPKDATVKLHLIKYGAAMGYYGQDYGFAVNTIVRGEMNGQNLPYGWVEPATGDATGLTMTLTDYTISDMGSSLVRTGTQFKKSYLLDTDYSPADFLLSYCKLFGLYFTKDIYDKKIYIRDRKTFYISGETVNVHSLIDRGNISITPVLMQSKWADFKLESDESEAGKRYNNTYGIVYGLQRTNTGYDFNADINDLFSGNLFRGGILAQEKSECFSYFDDDRYKPWMLQGYNYLLYKENDNTATHEVEYKEESTIGVLRGYSDLKYYDLFPKMQFHSDGNNPEDGSKVLVFYEGKKTTEADDGTNLQYWLTDDNADMMILNDSKPCWLYTIQPTDAAGNTIALSCDEVPMFGRYHYFNGSETIAKSLDFGTPKEFYVPTIKNSEDSTLYEQYWQRFVTDLYSPATRVLKVKVLVNDRIDTDWFRRFYWFDNCIWRLNSISDYNMCGLKPTTMEFVKVQDIENYSLDIDYSDNKISIASEWALPNIIPSGDTSAMTVTVTCDTEDTSWYVDYDDTKLVVSPTSGVGSSTFTFNTTGVVYGEFSISVISDRGQATLDFRKNAGYMVLSCIDPSTTQTPLNHNNHRITVDVWSSFSYAYNTTWHATVRCSVSYMTRLVNWTKASGKTTSSHLPGNDYCIFEIPANFTGTDITWTLTVNDGANEGTLIYTQLA